MSATPLWFARYTAASHSKEIQQYGNNWWGLIDIFFQRAVGDMYAMRKLNFHK
ncbi:hypothetical protein ACL9RI_12200 [Janthinobacterium sp. Mn2066]|uniref:hypothetical protein n=1 Tax=Janthinobacterium sp. Mn2066 TaxID=3395264 RepID=UPI003BEAE8C5